LAIQGPVGEEIEIHRHPMAVAQGDGGTAIEHKANSGQACQRGPEPLLPLRQDFKVGS
jgi:hypothetical protein